MNLHDKNTMLESKLDLAKAEHEKKSEKEIERIRQKYEKMAEEIR